VGVQQQSVAVKNKEERVVRFERGRRGGARTLGTILKMVKVMARSSTQFYNFFIEQQLTGAGL
jgi:hypothetical protein